MIPILVFAFFITFVVLMIMWESRSRAFDLEECGCELEILDDMDFDWEDGDDTSGNEEVVDRPKIVCLCGSTKFHEAFIKANMEETLAGNIVLSVGFFMHSAMAVYGHEIDITVAQKENLDVLHKEKILLADEVLILNVGGYIGSSTRSEIEFSKDHFKTIRYLEPIPVGPEGYPAGPTGPVGQCVGLPIG
jgi:hypothetical protein